MSASITETEIRRHLGALRQPGRMMLAENCSAKVIPTALRWLRRENARGSHIFVRPAGIHHLSLVDDVSAPVVAEMTRLGTEPTVVVETSPTTFRHGSTMDEC